MNSYETYKIKKRPAFCKQPDIASAQFDDQPKDLSIKRKAVDLFVCAVIQDIVLNSVYKRSKIDKPNFRPESPVFTKNESISNIYDQNIHLRGINTPSNNYTNGFISSNEMPTGWNSFGQPSATSTFTEAMTPPTSPSSFSSESEPENLSVNFSSAAASVNTNNPNFECEKCFKVYSTSAGLCKHRQYHCPTTECNHEKKQHACEDCGKSYPTMGALNMHTKIHTLPCKCPICGKAFPRQWQLQGHIRIHTGEKPFSCTNCNRSFADSSNLRAHQQIHAEVRKFVCKVCNKSFSRMSLLNKHSNSNNCVSKIVKFQ